jgi:hypothetical protein
MVQNKASAPDNVPNGYAKERSGENNENNSD